jgi:hypothetical protein
MISLSPLAGVPVRFVVIEVIAAAKAVIVNSSVVSVLILGVALLVTVFIRGVLRLLLKVSVPARVARVPVVGRVTPVVAVRVRVRAKAPEVVTFPPRVMVFPEFATPVPPYNPATTVAFQTPVVIVPTETSEERVVTAVFTKVPEVGRVTLVVPVTVRVVAKAPEVTKLPPRVMVLAPLLTPVPPYVPVTIDPFQVPAVMVPKVTILVWPAYVEAIVRVGLPETPSPLVTVILSAVPVIVRPTKVSAAV